MSAVLLPPAPRPTYSSSTKAPTPLAYRPVDDGWVQWVAENRLRDCAPATMLATMTKAGLDPREAEQVIHKMEQDPVFQAARRHQQLHRKLESILANQQALWESASHYKVVEKRSHVAPEEFVERYVRGCRPVVLTGVARDWPALARWSPEDLKTRFGHLDVEVQSERGGDPRYEENKLAHRRKVRLSDFVNQVVAGGATNDYYLTANNEALRRPEFAALLDDIGQLPDICDRKQLPYASSFWFGPAGTITPLHHDTLMLFHTQIVGRKRWRFVSPLQTPRLYNHQAVFSPIDLDAPDFARHPDFQGVEVLDVVVEPGETMFLPLGWWHQVKALDVSLSFSYSNLSVPNTFSYQNPDIRNW